MHRDYRTLVLSNKEKFVFIFAVWAAGLIIAWLFYNSYVTSVIISILLLPILPLYKNRLLKKRRLTLLEQFRDILYSISASISSGHSMTYALNESMVFWKDTYDEKSIIMQELDYMVRNIMNSNENEIDVLMDFSKRAGMEDISDFVSVFAGCRENGGDLSVAIEKSASIITDKITIQSELEAMMAQKRFESRIVSFSPFIMVGFIRLMMPNYLDVMYETNQGRVMMTIALILIMASLIFIERINNIEI